MAFFKKHRDWLKSYPFDAKNALFSGVEHRNEIYTVFSMLKIGKRSEKSIGNRLKNVFSMLVSFFGIESHFGKRNRCNKARTILATQQRGSKGTLGWHKHKKFLRKVKEILMACTRCRCYNSPKAGTFQMPAKA